MQPNPNSGAEPQSIARDALTFLLSEPSRAQRFLDDTGLSPGDLRARVNSDEVLEATLDALLRDESLLLMFAANQSIKPEVIVEAAHALATRNGRPHPQQSI